MLHYSRNLTFATFATFATLTFSIHLRIQKKVVPLQRNQITNIKVSNTMLDINSQQWSVVSGQWSVPPPPQPAKN